MAKYGTNVYGDGSLYGSSNVTFIDLDATPVTATPYGYNAIQVTWNEPTGSWTNLAIVRNPFGFPVNYDDGVVVYQAGYQASQTSFIDYGQDQLNNSGLNNSYFYHYGVFLQLGNGTWQRAGFAYSIVVKQYNSSEYMYRLVPSAFKTTGLNTLADTGQNSDLEAFFDVIGFEIDRVKTYANIVLNSTSSSQAYTPLIPAVLQQYGTDYEPELGVQSGRIYIKNAARIGREKGSSAGLTDFIKSYSQYDCSIAMGKNLFLDYNDSSFEESTGNWSAGTLNATTGAWTPLAGYIDAYLTSRIPTKVPYVNPNSTALYPNRVSGFLEAQTQTTTTTYACGADAPTLKGIPVIGGDAYTFSAYSSAATAARTIRLSILWYNLFGVYISQSIPSGGTNTLWNSSNPWSSRITHVAAAPSAARWAVPVIQIVTTVNEYHYFDALQFEQASAATNYEDSRLINITLIAQRINSIIDPSFVNTLTNYTIYNTTAAQDIISYSTNSSESLKLSPTLASYSPFNSPAVSGVSGSATISITDITLMQYLHIGMAVVGTGVAANTVISAIDYPNLLVTLSSALSANTSGTYSFRSYEATITHNPFISVLPGYWYTASGFFRTGYTGPISGDWIGRFEVDWYDSNKNLLYTDFNLPQHLTDYYDIGSYLVTANRIILYARDRQFDYNVGETFVVSGLVINGTDYSGSYTITYSDTAQVQALISCSNTTLTEVPVSNTIIVQNTKPTFEHWYDSYISPSAAAYAKVRFAWLNPQTGQNLWMDNWMFERSSALNTFFDGSFGFSVATDMIWEGTPNASRSHYYRNLKTIEQRLVKELPNYLPNGSSFQLLVAQPGTL